MAFDHHVAARRDFCIQDGVLPEPAHEHAGAPVDEALGQPLVQRVGQLVLHRLGFLAPDGRLGQPVGLVGDEGPGADMGDARRQRVDVAVGAVGLLDPLGDPVVGNHAAVAHEAEDLADQLRMLGRRYLAVIGKLRHVPQAAHLGRAAHPVRHLLVARQRLQRLLVLRRLRPRQALRLRRLVEARLERRERGEVERVAAPLDGAHRLEAVRLQRLHQRVGEGVDAARHPEGAVMHVAAGAPGDLAELGGGELAELVAVIFAVGGEGDVIEVEVEAHPDGVGGHQEVDVAGLVDLHLLVARARAERPQHHRGPAALAADQLAHRVDLVGGEGDDRRALRQPRQLLLPRIGEHRHARARHHMHARQQLLDDAAHGGGAEKQRLLAAAQIQDAVGEDVPALQVGGDLHLVDGDEGGVGLARHRLHGGDPVARMRRDDLLLARHQRHLVLAGTRRHARVDLARQQPKRQADDAALVTEHALDRQMRLAGVGRSEYGRDVPGAPAPGACGCVHV